MNNGYYGCIHSLRTIDASSFAFRIAYPATAAVKVLRHSGLVFHDGGSG